MACLLDVNACNKTVNNELEDEELERYYVGDLFIENYK